MFVFSYKIAISYKGRASEKIDASRVLIISICVTTCCLSRVFFHLTSSRAHIYTHTYTCMHVCMYIYVLRRQSFFLLRNLREQTVIPKLELLPGRASHYAQPTNHHALRTFLHRIYCYAVTPICKQSLVGYRAR